MSSTSLSMAEESLPMEDTTDLVSTTLVNLGSTRTEEVAV